MLLPLDAPELDAAAPPHPLFSSSALPIMMLFLFEATLLEAARPLLPKTMLFPLDAWLLVAAAPPLLPRLMLFPLDAWLLEAAAPPPRHLFSSSSCLP